MSRARPITLLHLSDPQFGPKHRFDGDSPGSLFARLRDDFDAMRARHDLVPDLILITGDLVEYGKPSEFREFRRFAEALAEHFSLPRRKIILIPGNHDISRDASDSYFKRCESLEETPNLPYWPKLENYARLFAEFYAGEPDLTFTETAPYTLFEYPDLHVVVAGLNSTIADSHRPEDHYGFLGEPQLRFFAGKLRAFAEQGYLRIAAVHHNPYPTTGSTHDLKDLPDLKRLLRPHLNLLVHGHVHEEELNWLDNTVPVLGIGSAGVDLKQRPPEVPNQYQWIRIHADRLEFGTRAYVPDQKRWIDDLRPDQDGKQWWQSKTIAFERVTAAFTTPSQPAPTEREDALAREVALYRERLAAQLRNRIDLSSLATYGEDSDLSHGLDLLRIFVPQPAVHEVPSEDRPRGSEITPRIVDVHVAANPSPSRISPALIDALVRSVQRPTLIHISGLHIADLHAGPVFVPAPTPPAPIDVLTGSGKHPWILLLGAPGAGKTTLTYWTALKLCADGEHLGYLPQSLVPVRIDLRLFAEHRRHARASGRADGLLDYLAEVPYPRLHRDDLEALARSGRLFWLFDGLDEVTDPNERQTIIDQILDTRTRHGGHGIVTGRLVGCRPHQATFHAADIHCFTLHDLDSSRIDDFLERWHTLVYANTPDVGARRLARLRETLAHDRGVRDLCGNPLLLTLIALLNRGDELPRRRHKLLGRASELMLSQWDANKGLPNTTPFDLALKHRYLAELAWHMMNDVEGGAGNIIKADALEAFTTHFCGRTFALDPTSAASTARALIKHLRERNYVLGYLGTETFGFLHKAFFEFFAAEEIIRRFHAHDWRLEDLERLFAEHWQDPAWYEPLLLTCGLLQEVRVEHVVAVLQAAIASTWPIPILSVSEKIAVFVVSSLNAVHHLGAGVAHDFALAVIDWLSLSYINVSSLVRAFHTVPGHWPELEAAIDRALRAKPPRHEIVLPLLAGLPETDFGPTVLRLLTERRVYPSIVLDAYHADLWKPSHTELLLRGVSRSTALIFALALAHSKFLPWPAHFRAMVVDACSHQFKDSLHRYFVAIGDSDKVSETDSRTIRITLTLALAHDWPELGLTHDFSRDLFLSELSPVGARELRASLTSSPRLRERLPQISFEIIRSKDPDLLRDLLESRDLLTDSHPLIEALSANPWEDGFDHIISWASESPTRAELALEIRALKTLYFPETEALSSRVLRSLDVYAQARIPPPNSWFRRVFFFDSLEETEKLVLARAVQSFPDLDREIHLLFLSYFGHSNELARALESATRERPLLAAYFSQYLGDQDQRAARLMAWESQALISDVRSPRDEPLLLDVARRAKVSAARHESQRPWQDLLRHLSEHAVTPSVQIDAATELGDYDLLARLKQQFPEQARIQAALDLLDARQRLLQIGKPRRALVRLDGTRVGLLTELPGGDTRFTYDAAYLADPGAHPLAPTLPLRSEPYDSPGLHPIFAALLPQGWLLDIDLRRYNLRPGDEFGLLLATGRDTIGAIEIIPE